MDFRINTKRNTIYINGKYINVDNKINLIDYITKNKIKKCKNIYYESDVFILDIPTNIQYIQYNKNNNIFKYLPCTIKHLVLGGEFNQLIN